MNLKNKKVFLTRPYKVVYKDGDRIIKVFTKEHGKANVFNEALCQARVEESGLDIPKVLEVTEIDGEWAVVIEFVEGKTLEELMKEHPENLETYMEQFVDLQLAMHEKKAPRLTLQKDKFARKITSLKDELDATTRYELMTRLDSMPDHTKLCHGDFNPSNVIVKEDGSMKIVDWAHATQGNAKRRRRHHLSGIRPEGSEDGGSVSGHLLQKERHRKAVCAEVASHRGCRPAHQERA